MLAAVSIDRPILAAMLAHAREALPLECCGLLTGEGNHTSGIRKATNQLASDSAFFIPPEELFEFFRALRGSVLQLTGIYHSHPRSSAVPSARDIAESHYRDICYWIISLAGREPDIRCYRWGKMTFEEIGYEVV
ncbi:MAG: M67 family peptidase [Acidobacteria bacterium]|nr:MAG: M67 family peptidase [Acidobacteriota bacterium]